MPKLVPVKNKLMPAHDSHEQNHVRFEYDCMNTVKIKVLNTGTCRSKQTLQTQIKMLLKEKPDQGLLCLPFPPHLLDVFLHCKAKLFTFTGQLQELFRVSQFLDFLPYFGKLDNPIKESFGMFGSFPQTSHYSKTPNISLTKCKGRTCRVISKILY